MHIVFRIETEFFKGTAPRPDAVNELIGGDEIAHWMRKQLISKGFDASEIWPEDHGFDFSVKSEEKSYLIVSSCDFEEFSRPQQEHTVQVTLERSILDKLFGRNKGGNDDPVVSAVRGALAGNSDFRIIDES